MKKLTALLLALSTVSCGGGGDDDTQAQQVTVAVFKSLGSSYCVGGGTPAGVLQNALVNAGVQVISASCGIDGIPRAPLCGTSNGVIGIFEIALGHASVAEALGFGLLATLPNAQRTPC